MSVAGIAKPNECAQSLCTCGNSAIPVLEFIERAVARQVTCLAYRATSNAQSQRVPKHAARA